MIKLNKRMAEIISGQNFMQMSAPIALLSVLNEGFVATNGCAILASLEELGRSVSFSDFPDKTGYECFVNAIHIDDYVDSDLFSCSLLYAGSLLRAWKERGVGGVIRVIVSCDDLGGVVRFHLIRDDEDWVASDLELYEEAVLVVDSDLNEAEEESVRKGGRFIFLL